MTKDREKIGRKMTSGTTSGTIRLQVPFQNSPLLFQNSFLMIFHDFWSLGALFFTIFGPCLVCFSDMFFILLFCLLIYVFIQFLPQMPNIVVILNIRRTSSVLRSVVPELTFDVPELRLVVPELISSLKTYARSI